MHAKCIAVSSFSPPPSPPLSTHNTHAWRTECVRTPWRSPFGTRTQTERTCTSIRALSTPPPLPLACSGTREGPGLFSSTTTTAARKCSKVVQHIHPQTRTHTHNGFGTVTIVNEHAHSPGMHYTYILRTTYHTYTPLSNNSRLHPSSYRHRQYHSVVGFGCRYYLI